MNSCFETATSLARAIRNKKLTSREATEAHLDRIARLNGPINALVVVDREGALKAARAADRAAAKKGVELGSDIGGSVRNPAHYNGIFSLKPSEWRVPGRGHVPDLPGVTRVTRYMGVFGPLARSVDDLELALRTIAGPDGYEAEVPPMPL